MSKVLARGGFARAGLALLAVSAVWAPGAAAEACTRTWTAGSGTWTDAADWSPAGVPDATDDVCLPAGAAYTVTVPAIPGGSATARSITVGGSGPGAVTLLISGAEVQPTSPTLRDALLTASGGGTIGADGTVVLDGAEAGGASLAGGSIANYGTIASQTEALNPVKNHLRASVVNEVGGTLRLIKGTLVTDNGATFQNLGTVLANGPGSWELSTDPALSATPTHMINAAVVVGSGAYGIGATWTQAGGIVSGGTIFLTNSLLDYQAGTGSFSLGPDIQGNGTSQLAGTVPSGQTVTALGTLQLVGSNVTNQGTLSLGPFSLTQYTASQPLVLTGAPLTNAGSLTFTGGAFPRAGDHSFLRTQLMSNGVVTLAPGVTLVQDSGTTFQNVGTLELAADAHYSLSAAAGTPPSTLDTSGTLRFDLGPSSSGQIQLGPGGVLAAAADLLALPQGFTNRQGQTYAVVTSSGGSVTGAFTEVRDGFRLLTPAPNTISLVFGQVVSHAQGGRLGFTLVGACPLGYSSCHTLVVHATAKERVVRWVGKGRKRRRVVRTVTTVVASTSTILGSSETRILTVPLNAHGRQLVRRAGHALPISVVALSDGTTVLRATVHVRP